MTDHSNPITDILQDYFQTVVKEAVEANGENIVVFAERSKKVRESSQQALYEAVKSCKPLAMVNTNEVSEADYFYGYGYNAGVETFLTNLSLLFGVDLGSSQDQKQLKAQGHEADNLNAGANHG